MTPRKRVEAILRGEPADRVPLTIYQGLFPRSTAERQLRNEGLCMVNGFMVFTTETPNVMRETHDYAEEGARLVRTTYHTPVGDLFIIRKPHGITSWTVSHLFKQPEDYQPWLFKIKDQQYRPDYEDFAKAERDFGEDAIFRAGIGATPLHEIMQNMGLETFAVEWAERRDEIMKIYDAMVEQLRQRYPLVAQSPALHANFGGNETADVMGKERFEKYVVPHYNEAGEILHQHGKLFGPHLDGNNKVWAQAVADSAVDYVEAFTPAPDCDMTLSEALEAWPDKVLWINFPSSVHLEPIPKIEDATRQLLREAAPGNRLIIGITEDIPADRWQQNMLAISRVINQEGRLPIR